MDGSRLTLDTATMSPVVARELPSQQRTREAVDMIIAKASRIKLTEIVVQHGDGRRVDFNAATTLEPVGIRPDGTTYGDAPYQMPAGLGVFDYPMGGIGDLPEEFALAREAGRMGMQDREAYNRLMLPPQVVSRMIAYRGRLMFDPLAYGGAISSLYGSRPMFVGGRYTQNALCLSLALYCEGLMAKRRAAAALQAIQGLGMDGSSFIRAMNRLARVFGYPLYLACRALLASKCKVLQADGTPVFITDGRASPGSSRKTYLWGVSSGPYEDYQVVIYHGGTDRTPGNFLSMLGIEDGGSLAAEVLVTDGYAGYGKALRMIKEATGREIATAGCWAHAYRMITDALGAMGLYGTFSEALGKRGDDDYAAFGDRLDALLAARGKGMPSQDTMDFTWLAMLVSNIFHMEESISGIDRAEAQAYRQSGVAPVVDSVFRIARDLARRPSSHIGKASTLGDAPATGLRAPRGTAMDRALVYLLNGEASLRRFVGDARIPCTNSSSERAMRPHAVHRGNSHVFRTMDGHMGLAILQSLRMTCERNGIPFADYLQWAVTELKWRHEERRQAMGTQAQTFRPPPSPTAIEKDPDGNDTEVPISMYDPRYRCETDGLPTEGLTPIDYKALILRRANLDMPGD